MCTGYGLVANAGLGALGALTGYANRDKLRSGWRKLTGGVDKVTDKVSGWADDNLKIN